MIIARQAGLLLVLTAQWEPNRPDSASHGAELPKAPQGVPKAKPKMTGPKRQQVWRFSFSLPLAAGAKG